MPAKNLSQNLIESWEALSIFASGGRGLGRIEPLSKTLGFRIGSKIALALSPLLLAAVWIGPSDELCRHPDGAGPTQAIDPEGIERGYRERLTRPAAPDWAESKPPKRAALPDCGTRSVRTVEIPPVTEKLVGHELFFSREDPALAPEAAERLHLRCLNSRVKIVDRTHLVITEE